MALSDARHTVALASASQDTGWVWCAQSKDPPMAASAEIIDARGHDLPHENGAMIIGALIMARRGR